MLPSKVTRLIIASLASTLWLVSTVVAENNYPIVLVHGLTGWSRSEFAGVKYWGGIHGDYEQDLRAQGYDVRTAAIGPFSSNWDRACELYAYIKGGCVNYGPNHAKKHGHNATGRCFEGIYPEWGNVVDGKVNKVHFLAHSMGGQTVRMLAQLLAHGTKGAPLEEDASTHPLFAGGKDWVHSITTVSACNQGMVFWNAMDQVGELVKTFLGAAVSAANSLGGRSASIYDAKLDQWGVAPRKSDESLSNYIQRIWSSRMFQPGFADFAFHDMTTAVANNDLKWVKTLPNIFYYSFSTQDTFRLFDVELPRVQSMLPIFQPLSVLLGSKYPLTQGFSREWQANDGLVNTISMRYDGAAEVVDGPSESKTGRWHHLAKFTTLDHLAIVGFKPFKNVLDVYQIHAKLLYNLPVADGKARRLEDGSIVHTTPPEIVEQLKRLVKELNAPNEEEDIRATCTQPKDDTTKQLCEKHFKSKASF
ncbi:TPA: hypothetical protein N0F65_012347 [Lagenidium giganteum]|uniref:Lipase-like C-terminal domain-containing protein n=1 Tax=Lagenidium giganteum TaxID=4803 RepID=A0AAV2YKN1_9STRA|nr:TPA: hypothetical protein N0F65_012347 [Lagenidium giganteum]